MSQFVHLHLHTQYSLLDGVNKIPDILKQAQQLGQPAIAITDHGNMHGALEFYEAAKKIDLKPILGCEVYLNPVSRFERKAKNQGGAPTHHLTVLAKNKKGYQNLCHLVSLAYREGFYFKPRIDHEILEKYKEGLIVLSGCLQGELAGYVENDNIEGARNLIDWYLKTFSDNFYLEIQPHTIPAQQKLNQACIELAKDLGAALVATTDCHYPKKEDHFAQEVLMCISTGRTVQDPERIRHEGVDLHLKSASEMYDEFGSSASYADEAIKNSVAIAERCGLSFDFSTFYMPRYPLENSADPLEVMAEKARTGMEKRLEILSRNRPAWNATDRDLYYKRLEEEIVLIGKMGFAGYFLVVADFINWSKEHEIPVGPGRGSAAGSLVAYAMRITEVDPIFHKLLFERFLNPERVSLPDIDVDFCIYGRDQVIAYVVNKYGKDNVAQIATFGTLKAKAAIKDVGRALGLPYAETDKIAQLIPAPRQGFDYSLAESLAMEKRLKDYAEGEGQELISLAMKLEGLTRHSSTHAAGVVIGDRPLVELLPMMVDKDGNDVTQYTMKYVEKIGLVKFDFLGLKTLTVIQSALKIIAFAGKEKINFDLVQLDDPQTYALLCAGNTTGVFQLESTGITDMTMRLKPSCFDDLVATIALYRPGPLDAGMVDHYIARKHGKEKVVYLHPLMSKTLEDTYGIILYQEQIMQLARELAGYSLGEADLLRRAMGKKVPEEMAKQRDRFISGAVKQQINQKIATEIFDQMETFARYGFNRSHSAAYAYISFQTAYLKAHYPVEFMAALMSSEIDDTDKVLKNFTECRKQKLTVLPPNVNNSQSQFSVQANQICYGLAAVKGVGEKAVEAILQARNEGGEFEDFENFLERVNIGELNRKVLENLIKCGAFDWTKLSRHELSNRLEDALRQAQSIQKEKDSRQLSIFQDSTRFSIRRPDTRAAEWPVNKKLSQEREALGFYISGHPLDKYFSSLERLGAINTIDVKSRASNSEVKVAGMVTALRLRNTKKGDRYASFILEDSCGTLEALVWPKIYHNIGHLLANDDPVLLTAKVDATEERCVLIVDGLESLIALRDKSAKQAILDLRLDDYSSPNFQGLQALFKQYEGACTVRAKLFMDEAEVLVSLRDSENKLVAIQASEELSDKAEQMFGRPVVYFA